MGRSPAGRGNFGCGRGRSSSKASIEELKTEVERLDAELASLETKGDGDTAKQQLSERRELLVERIKRAKEKHANETSDAN